MIRASIETSDILRYYNQVSRAAAATPQWQRGLGRTCCKAFISSTGKDDVEHNDHIVDEGG